MDTWWTNAKLLKTGDTQARCISCHTAVPYALARPALRRLVGEGTPTANEARILETVQSRVRSHGNKQPYYDQNEDKKIESAGVEAVLNAFVLTRHDVDVSAEQPTPETKAAVAQLWQAQRSDGAWNWLNFGLEPYEAPDAVFHGATLAAMAVGTAPGLRASADVEGQAGLERLKSYLRRNVQTQRLFNRTWALLAASRLEGALRSEQRVAIARELESRQRPDGGWSLVDLGTWRWGRQDAPFAAPGETDPVLLSAADGYATGLAVYALRESGIVPSKPAIARGQEWLRSHQATEAADGAWAPWRAYSLNFDREHGGPKGEPWRRLFMSDLATAFGVLALAQ
jgi:squalene-hopene/tetraprenyl-beta-curcumene cyclase